MTAEELIKAIHDNCIAIRVIPEKVKHMYDFRHYQDGDEIKEVAFATMSEDSFLQACEKLHWNKQSFFWRDGSVYRKWVRRYTYPQNAGKWMAKRVEHNDTIIMWKKSDGMFDTLEEAVLNAIKNE